MVDEDLEVRISEVGKPFEQPFLIRMGRKSTQGVDMGSDSNLLAKKPDGLRPINDPSPNRTFRLIADEDDVGFGPPEVVFQVMLDPAGVTHPTSRYDDS